MRWRTYTLALLACLPLACGVITSSEGSNTNWLSPCSTDADCDGNKCLCGVCTTPCGDRPCSQAAAECRRSVSTYCADGEGEPICTATCTRDAECTELEPQLICLRGECVRNPDPEGTGGGGGGGQSSAAGTESGGRGAPDSSGNAGIAGQLGSSGGSAAPSGGSSRGGAVATGGTSGSGGATTTADSCTQCEGLTCLSEPNCALCPPDRLADGQSCDSPQLSCYFGPACGQTACTCTVVDETFIWRCVTNAC